MECNPRKTHDEILVAEDISAPKSPKKHMHTSNAITVDSTSHTQKSIITIQSQKRATLVCNKQTHLHTGINVRAIKKANASQ